MKTLKDYLNLEEPLKPNIPEFFKNRNIPEFFKNRNIEIVMWNNSIGNKEFYTFSINKVYMDKNSGQWERGKSFSLNDIDKLINLLEKVRNSMIERGKLKPKKEDIY